MRQTRTKTDAGLTPSVFDEPLAYTLPTHVLAEMNRDLLVLHERIIRLRYEDPPKGSREQAFDWLRRKVDALAAAGNVFGEAGSPAGWDDPTDPFAGDQITVLRMDLEELLSGSYPVPLLASCTLLPQANFDPFAHGRRYNGTVL